MKVDRARFLLLTTGLSAATVVAVAAGCTVKSSDSGSSGTTTPPTEAGTPYDSATVPTDATTEDGGGCLDDTGTDPNCDGITEPTCAMACQHYLLNYKKGVARSIAKCIGALGAGTSGYTCTGKENEIAACVQTALGDACSDPTAEGWCAPFVAACDSDAGTTDGGAAHPLEQKECVEVVTGLNTMGRGQFRTCLTDNMTTAGYCAANPSACIDQIE